MDLTHIENSIPLSDGVLERINGKSNNNLDDRITSILVGFKHVLEERDGWIDIITVREAQKEIKELIVDCIKAYAGGIKGA